MATVFVTISKAMGGNSPVYSPISSAAQKITSSGTSQKLSISCQTGDYVAITSVGGAIAVRMGINPTAVSGAAGTHFIADGQSKDFGPMSRDDEVAVIDA